MALTKSSSMLTSQLAGPGGPGHAIVDSLVSIFPSRPRLILGGGLLRMLPERVARASSGRSTWLPGGIGPLQKDPARVAAFVESARSGLCSDSPT